MFPVLATLLSIQQKYHATFLAKKYFISLIDYLSKMIRRCPLLLHFYFTRPSNACNIKMTNIKTSIVLYTAPGGGIRGTTKRGEDVRISSFQLFIQFASLILSLATTLLFMCSNSPELVPYYYYVYYFIYGRIGLRHLRDQKKVSSSG